MADFSVPTEEDFLDVSKAPPGTGTAALSARNEIAAKKAASAPSFAAQIEPSAFQRGLAGAGLSLTNKYRGLTGQEAAPGYGLEEDTAGQVGMAVPDAVGSMLAPARVVPQAIYGAVTRAAEPAPNVLERGVAGLKGAAEFGGGQALASTAVKGINTMAGDLTRAGQVARAADPQGLKLSAGDILDSNLLRTLEGRTVMSPTARQGEQVAAQMTREVGDPISVAVQNAYKVAQQGVSDAALQLDDIIKTQNLTGVVPRKTYAAVQEIAKRSPDTLNNVRDPELRAMLEAIANYPTNRIPKGTEFARLDELRKVLGPIMAKVEQQSKSGASNINTADAARWKSLYKGIMDDIEGWGSAAANKEALAAHKTLSTTFKQQVLPMREHPIAGKILEGKYDRPEDLLRDLTSVRNKTIVDDLYGRLDQGGKNAFDALQLTKRGSKEFVRGESTTLTWPEKIGAYGLAATSPAWAPAAAPYLPMAAAALLGEQGLVHALNSPVGRAIASGSAKAAKNPLANAAIHSALRTALPQAGLSVLGSRPEQELPRQ